jgi:putative glycosyltransferase (TIGR04372 family)
MNRINHHISAIQKKGRKELFRKIRVLNKFVLERIWFIIFLPFSILLLFLIRAIRPFFIIRISFLISWRIGHYAGNMDMYLCERKNNINLDRIKIIDLWFDKTKPCNSQFKIMLKRVINIYPRWLLHPIYILNNWIPGGAKNIIPENVSSDRDILNLTYTSEKASPINANNIEFTKKEEQKGMERLIRFGLNHNSKFVCLVVRDSAYLEHQKNENSTGVDWSYQDYRDTSIQNYILAAEELVKNGYYVFRMGSVVNEPMNINNEMIIDYATNGMRSEFMDIYLSAKCEFCISSGTGIDAVSSLFRRPKLIVNLESIEYFHSFFLNDITLFRKMRNINNKELLSIKSIIDKGVGGFSRKDSFSNNGVELIENTPIEIKDAVVEMILRTSGEWNDNWYDIEVKPVIESIFSKSKLHGKILSKFSTSFLRENKYLLKEYIE